MSSDSQTQNKKSSDDYVVKTPVITSENSSNSQSSDYSSYKDEVLVYILEGNDSSRAEHLADLFRSNLFATFVVKIDAPKNISDPVEAEKYAYEWCLKDAKNKEGNQHVIIVKDTVYSHYQPSKFAKTIYDILDEVEDVVYLNRYQDKCGKRSQEQDSDCKFAPARSPHGTHSLLFSPRGRDMVLEDSHFRAKAPLSHLLNSAIVSGRMKAHCFAPNLVHIDPTSVNNQVLLQECQGEGFYFLWFIIIILILIFILYAISKFYNY